MLNFFIRLSAYNFYLLFYRYEIRIDVNRILKSTLTDRGRPHRTRLSFGTRATFIATGVSPLLGKQKLFFFFIHHPQYVSSCRVAYTPTILYRVIIFPININTLTHTPKHRELFVREFIEVQNKIRRKDGGKKTREKNLMYSSYS